MNPSSNYVKSKLRLQNEFIDPNQVEKQFEAFKEVVVRAVVDDEE